MNVPSSIRDNFSEWLKPNDFEQFLFLPKIVHYDMYVCSFSIYFIIFFHIKGNNPLKMNESTFVLLYHLYWEWVQRYQIWQMCRYQAAPSQFFRLESFSIPSSSITNYRPRRYLHSENRCSGVEKEALCKRTNLLSIMRRNILECASLMWNIKISSRTPTFNCCQTVSHWLE